MVPKFRAYIKDLDEFDYNDVPHKGHFVYGNLIKGKPNDDVDAIVGDLIEIHDEYVNVEWWQSIEKGSAEQSTGLKDANGKEICEGDILATSSRIGGKLITDYLKVDWREDYAGFFCGETPLYACLSEWNNDIKYPQTFPEIAGNAHENPELLEVQHG